MGNHHHQMRVFDGLSQRSVLGPMLFNIFVQWNINDQEQNIKIAGKSEDETMIDEVVNTDNDRSVTQSNLGSF